MEKRWPAIDARGGSWDVMVAAVAECSPSAVEERNDGARIFFASTDDRNAAITLLHDYGFSAAPLEVSDENWAERSQADLAPVTVGRFTIFPDPTSRLSNPDALTIPPSIAFGTGHHATTRLCLAALQRLELEGCQVLDVGTGSGVLAIAAARLGAAGVVGLDSDPDAIRTARENLTLNGGDARLRFECGDLRSLDGQSGGPSVGCYDCVVANLTGVLLVRSAPILTALLRPGGHVVLGGLLAGERDDVVKAFGGAAPIWEDEEDGWAVVVLSRR